MHDPGDKLLRNFRDLGFLQHVKGDGYVVIGRRLPRTAFLLMLLERFAPEPGTVHVPEVLAHPFWRFLGGREEREVRETLSAAETRGILRQERVDQLDQIVTRIGLAEALEQRVYL